MLLLENNCELGQLMKHKFEGVNFSISTLNTKYSKVCSDIKCLSPHLEFNSVEEIDAVNFGVQQISSKTFQIILCMTYPN